VKDYVIEVEGMTKRFGDFTAVDNLTMRIERGTVHGFLGPNGSGKTTAIRVMCGLLDPTEGNITVLGMKVPEQAPLVRRQVGYMTQRFSNYTDLTVEENISFLARVHGISRKERKERIAEVIDRFDLREIANRLAGALSGGQKRRLALAGAVLTKPKLLILDEPTSEVDPNTRRDMWADFFQLANDGTSILVTTHLMDEAERCHNLTMLSHGVKKADGSIEQLLDDLPQAVVRVDGPQVTPLAARLAQDKGVVAATQTGLHLRVLVEADVSDPVHYLQDLCGPDYQLERTEPSVEDVFVAATRG